MESPAYCLRHEMVPLDWDPLNHRWICPFCVEEEEDDLDRLMQIPFDEPKEPLQDDEEVA